MKEPQAACTLIEQRPALTTLEIIGMCTHKNAESMCDE